MLQNEVLEEGWKAKDEIARQSGFDIKKLVADLNARTKIRGDRVVDRSQRKRKNAA